MTVNKRTNGTGKRGRPTSDFIQATEFCWWAHRDGMEDDPRVMAAATRAGLRPAEGIGLYMKLYTFACRNIPRGTLVGYDPDQMGLMYQIDGETVEQFVAFLIDKKVLNNSLEITTYFDEQDLKLHGNSEKIRHKSRINQQVHETKGKLETLNNIKLCGKSTENTPKEYKKIKRKKHTKKDRHEADQEWKNREDQIRDDQTEKIQTEKIQTENVERLKPPDSGTADLQIPDWRHAAYGERLKPPEPPTPAAISSRAVASAGKPPEGGARQGSGERRDAGGSITAGAILDAWNAAVPAAMREPAGNVIPAKKIKRWVSRVQTSFDSIDDFCLFCQMVADHRFLIGQRPDGAVGWAASLEWCLRPTNLKRIQAGAFRFGGTGAGKPKEPPVFPKDLVEGVSPPLLAGWREFHELLVMRLGEAHWRAWCASLRLGNLDIHGLRLELVAPSVFVCRWIHDKRMIEELCVAAKMALGCGDVVVLPPGAEHRGEGVDRVSAGEVCHG